MNKIIKYLVVFGLLLGVTAVSVHAQNANFRSFRETKGVVTNKNKGGVYVWGPWQQSSTVFTLNISEKLIFVSDQLNNKVTKYKILDKPEKWTAKKDYKFINFECTEFSSMDKFYIRLYEYESGEFRINIMSPTEAMRYSVVFIKDDELQDVSFDDV